MDPWQDPISSAVERGSRYVHERLEISESRKPFFIFLRSLFVTQLRGAIAGNSQAKHSSQSTGHGKIQEEKLSGSAADFFSTASLHEQPLDEAIPKYDAGINFFTRASSMSKECVRFTKDCEGAIHQSDGIIGEDKNGDQQCFDCPGVLATDKIPGIPRFWTLNS